MPEQEVVQLKTKQKNLKSRIIEQGEISLIKRLQKFHELEINEGLLVCWLHTGQININVILTNVS